MSLDTWRRDYSRKHPLTERTPRTLAEAFYDPMAWRSGPSKAELRRQRIGDAIYWAIGCALLGGLLLACFSGVTS